MLTFVELFAGIGGFSLGLERAGMECIGHCEIDSYAQKVLRKHWPDIPLWEDITKLQPEEIGNPYLICGGFPCQDLSVAGKQKGITGERSGLFDEIIRLCRVCKPRYILLENVANLLFRPDWFGYVLGRIAEIGYDAKWKIISAADIGAPHLRKRVWILAYPNSGLCHRENDEIFSGRNSIDYGGEDVAHADEFKYRRDSRTVLQTMRKTQIKKRYEFRSSSQWEVEPDVGRVANGFPARVDRLRCLGNALVPQIAEMIGRNIIIKQKSLF